MLDQSEPGCVPPETGAEAASTELTNPSVMRTARVRLRRECPKKIFLREGTMLSMLLFLLRFCAEMRAGQTSTSVQCMFLLEEKSSLPAKAEQHVHCQTVIIDVPKLRVIE